MTCLSHIVFRQFCLVWLLLIGLMLPQQTVAQAPKSLDSLFQFLRTAPRDSVYMRAQNEATLLLTHKTPDYARADSLTRQQESLAQKLNNAAALYEAYHNRANVNFFKADYAQMLANMQKALAVAELRNLPRKVIYSAMSNVVIGYDRLGQDELLIQAALRAIRYQEQYDVRPRAPLPHRLIGSALVRMNRGQEAIPYYQKAGEIFRELGDPRGIAIFENQLGEFFVKLKQPRQALPHYRTALKMADQLTFDLLKFDALDGLANAYRLLGKPAEGLPFAQRALAIADKLKNALARAKALGSMGLLYKTQKNDGKAESYLTQALALAEKENSKEDIKTFNEALAELHGEQQHYKLAFEFQSQRNRLIDSAITSHTDAEVQRLLLRYETEKKEARIKLLQQQAKFNEQETQRTQFRTNALLIGAALLLLLSLAVGGWLLNRARLRRLQEAQQLRTQIAHDLHDDIGSTLSSISLLSGMVNDMTAQNRPDTARQMVEKIHTDARQILEAMDEIVWTINPGNDSLRPVALRLREYAQPLFDAQNIRLTVDIPAEIDTLPLPMDVRRNLYLIGKEAINNAAKYANATEVVIRFRQLAGQLQVQIEDNGRGFLADQPATRTGQRSMRQRAEAIGGRLVVESSPGQGTRVELVVNS